MRYYYGHPDDVESERLELEDLEQHIQSRQQLPSEDALALQTAAKEWVDALRSFIMRNDLDELSDADCEFLDDLFEDVSYRMAQVWERI